MALVVGSVVKPDATRVVRLTVTPFDVIHGKLAVTGFRFSDGRSEIAFITDCNFIPEESLAKLHGLDLLIIDALGADAHAASRNQTACAVIKRS